MDSKLYDIFANTASALPDNLAVIYFKDEDSEGKVTYRELQTQATKVAEILSESDTFMKTQDSFTVASVKEELESQKQNVLIRNQNNVVYKDQSASRENIRSRNDQGRKIIGLLCSPDPAALACIIGVLKTSAYLYISPDYTKAEVKSILGRSCPKLVIVEDKYFGSIADISTTVIGRACIFETHFTLVLCDAEKGAMPQVPRYLNELAYVIPTSGTTGLPKLVYVPHSCILPNILDLGSLFGVAEEDKIFCAAPLTFDPSVVDMFLAFQAGARLIMVSPYLLRIPRVLLHIMIKSRVTVLQATPTLMLSLGKDRLKESLLGDNSFLKVLALGGEIFPKLSVLSQWISDTCHTRIFNLYGITEVSCWATVEEVTVKVSRSCVNLNTSEKRIKTEVVTDSSYRGSKLDDFPFKDRTPIGKCLSSTVVKLLNQNGQDAMEGEEGEIFIGGSERMCWVDSTDNPSDILSCIQSEMLISCLKQTGDRGVLIHGKMYCIGRLDSQVKRNGQKVSLSEIERACNCLNYVDACHVVLHDKSTITAFVCPNSEHITEESVWNDLKSVLSRWKLPNNVVINRYFPISKNGKVNVTQLLSAVPHATAQVSKPLKSFYQEMWKRILACEEISPKDNFITCGGNSLSAVQFTEELENFLGRKIPNFLDVLLNETYQKTYNLFRKHKKTQNRKTGRSLRKKNIKKIKVKKHGMAADQYPHLRVDQTHLSLHNYKLDSTAPKEDICVGKTKISPKNPVIKFTVVSRRGIQNQGTESIQYKDLPMKLELLWKYDLEKCIDSSPVIIEYDDGTTLAFAGSHSQKFACIDALTGVGVWCVLLGGRIESSPIISRDAAQVYVGCYDCALYCICIKTGQVLWKYVTEGEVKSSPIVDPDTGNVMFGSHDKSLYCLTVDGARKWRNKLSHGSIFSSPCIYGDCVYAATLDGVVAAVDKETGGVNWKINVNNPVFSSIAPYSSGVIFGNVCGQVFSYSFSGSQLWTFQSKGHIFSSPAVLQLENGEEIISFGSHDFSVYFLNSRGELVAKYTGSSPIYSTPFLFPSHPGVLKAVICETSGKFGIVKVILNGSGSARVTDTAVETVVAGSFDGQLFSSPVLFKNRLFIGCRDNFMYCLNVT